MKQNKQQLAIAKKIKKWIQTTQEVEKARFAIPITRLTSIKSLCVDAEGGTRELGGRADNGLRPYTSQIKAAFMGGFTG
jgi:hypothetical protein